MKIFSSRKLSLIMAFVMLVLSFRCVSLASGGDMVLVDGIDSLKFANFKLATETDSSGVTEEGRITYETEFFDDVLQKNVVSYTSSAYAHGFGLYNTASREARHFVLGNSSAFKETLYNENNHKYMNLDFNIRAEYATDGLAFRINRYDVASDGSMTLNKATGYYFAVGGSGFVDSVAANANVTTGYSYTYRGLEPGKWHTVKLQLGADTDTGTIRFFVDGVQVSATEVVHTYDSTTKKVTKVTTTPAADEYTFPENTAGFGGRSENYGVLIPKGAKGSADVPNPFGLRISDFAITATNSEFNAEEEIVLPVKAFELTSDMELIRDEENGVAVSEVQAPHFAESYPKNVIRVSSGEAGYASGTGGYTASDYNQAGKAPGFTLISSDGGTIGNVDYSKYNYMRISFDIFVNDETNGVYFRSDRVDNGAVNKTNNYVFGVGASQFKTPSNNSAIHIHTNRTLSVGKWHSVVIELGAKAGNGTINYYIDGKSETVTFGKLNGVADNSFADLNTLYGFGGTSKNRCILVPKSNYGENLDMYLSDFVIFATNDAYSVSGVNESAELLDSEYTGAKYENGKIYSYGGLADGNYTDKFSAKNADYIGAADSGKYVMLYNKKNSVYKYYDVVNVTDDDIPYTQGLHADNLSVVSSGGEAVIKCNAYNLTGDYSKTAKLVVTYFKDDVLVEGFVKDIAFDDKVSYINEKITRNTSSYDFLKVFVWSDLTDMTILGEFAVEK